ncbi:MAG: polysaccharide biosynthesis C-terminal domain-containing protein, partial [Candidatus Micrarchaeota archaeon]|nr:polysaccharide biosynthesis C-terminal domain-containing protein [Candidatus Micrarchaeota archaeon]
LKEASNGASIQNALKLGITLVFILGFSLADAQSLAIATVLSFIVSIFYLYNRTRKEIRKLPVAAGSHFSKGYMNMAGELGTFGMTMIFVLLTATLITYTDRLLLGYFLKEGANSQIAIYSIATGLAGLVGLFAASIMAIFFPVISELHGKGDKNKMNGACATALRWILFFSLPIAAFLVAFSGPMLHLLYGAAYEPGALVLAFFSVGILISLLGTAQRTALAGMRQLQVERNVAIITFIANVVLNVLFIPLWGINGAALASAISLVGMAILNQHYANKLMSFTFPNSAWKNLAAGAISLAVLLLIETFAYNAILSSPIHFEGNSIVSLVLDKGVKLASLSIFFVVGAVVYLVLLNFMRLFEAEDVAVFKKIISRSGAPAWLQGAAVRAVFWNQK